MKRKIAKIVGYFALLILAAFGPMMIDIAVSIHNVNKMNPEVKKILMNQVQRMMDEDENGNIIDTEILDLPEIGI